MEEQTFQRGYNIKRQEEYQKSDASDFLNFSGYVNNRNQDVPPHKKWLFIILVFSLSSLCCMPFKFRRSISWKDYASQPRNEPYVLEFEEGTFGLLYYGAFHKVDLEHPQFEDIEERWDEFNPSVAFCEGSIWPLEETRQEAIRKHGEQGLLRYLAARDNVPVKSFDPSFSQQALFLKKCFLPNHVKIYFVLRQAIINRTLKREVNTLYVTQILKSFKGNTHYDCPPRSSADFEFLVEKVFPELEDWQMIPSSYFHWEEEGRFLARIHHRLNEYRDKVMLDHLRAAIKKGERVFALVGRSHVVMQESALRDLFD